MTSSIGGIPPLGVVLTGAAPLTGQPQPLANVTLVSVPAPLSVVDRPVLLQGVVVVAPDNQGIVRLQTALGDVILKTALPLVESTPLLLQVQIGQPPQTATLLTPGTQLPPNALPLPNVGNIVAQGSTPTPLPVPTVTNPVVNNTILSPTVTLGPAIAGATVPALFYPASAFTDTATLSSPPPVFSGGPALPSPSFSLPSLVSLGKGLFDRLTPPQINAPVTTISTTETPDLALPSDPPALTKSAIFSPTPLTTTSPSTGQATIIQLGAANEPLATLPNTTLGLAQRLTGTIIQQTPQGQPIVLAGQDIVVLQTTTSPAIGSQIVLDVRRPGGKILTDQAQSANTPALLPDWPTLDEATNALTLSAPAQASALRTALPQIGGNFSTPLVFLLTALRLGDVRALVGETPLKSLDRIGRRDLASKLQSDFKSLAEPSFEPVEPGWRGHSLPLQHQGEFVMVHFFTRPPPPDDEEKDGTLGENGDKASRFLVDLELSHLGPMQIEGRAAPHRVDVLLRTRQMIPVAIQQGLRDVFTDILDRQQIQGGLTFQGAGEGWLALMPRRHPHGSPPVSA